MQSGTGSPEYWESLLSLSSVYKAKAILKEIHSKLLSDQSVRKKEGSIRPISVSSSELEETPTAVDPIEARRYQLEREAERLRSLRAATKVEEKLPTELELLKR